MVRLIAALEYQFERLLSRTTLFPGRHLTADVIINLQAGALSSERRAAATISSLHELSRGVTGESRPREEFSIRFHITHYVGNAREITTALLAERVNGVQLIVSAGGDGTHAEVLSAYDDAMHSRSTSGDDRYFVRLPLGTGNDGADAPDLALAVRLLLGAGVPARVARIVAAPTGMPEFSGYNIASVGLDAYVAYWTNRLKHRFSGDLYKLIADVMTLFYERIVGSAPMRAELVDDGARDELTGVFLIFAMGVSGFRRYGGGKLVLPTYENICAVERLGLIGKLRFKPLFYRGDHVHEPNVHMRSARSVTISYPKRVPLQVDGETVWLEPDNFPLRIKVGNASVPVLRIPPSAQSNV